MHVSSCAVRVGVCVCVFEIEFIGRSAALSGARFFNTHLNDALIIALIITDTLKQKKCGCGHVQVGAHSCLK